MRLLTFLFLLCSFGASAQSTLELDTLFFDDFNYNAGNWTLPNSTTNTATLNLGKLNWTHTSEGNYFTWKSFQALHYEKNFILKVKFVYKSGDGKFGIVYGCKDVDNMHYFSLSGKKYTISQYDKNVLTHRKSGELSTLKSTSITLMIRREGTLMHYYINDTEVFQEKAPVAFGYKEGMMTGGNIKFDIEYYLIRQQRTLNINTSMRYASGVENLGYGVNGEYLDYSPVVTADGKGLYFAREESPENIGGEEDQEDIYYAEYKNGSWAKAINMGRPLNNSSPNAVMSVTPDGNKLFLLNKYTFKGEYLDEGFSISQRTKDGWSVPKNLLIAGFYDDSDYLEGFLCNDGKTLIMTTQMKDSHGEKDLYVSFLQKDGSWSHPLNLGPVINSSASEIYPFMAADGKTLYFASYGHPGFGEADIFVSRRQDNTWTNWTVPQNMGRPVNDEDWDAYFSIAASGDYAYLVKYQNSHGKGDIVRIKLPKEVKPEPVVLIHGKVFDAKTNQPLGADIYYESLSTNKEVGVAHSNPVTGEYQIVLPYGDQYGFRAESPNHLSVNDNLDLTVKGDYIEINRDLYLQPIQIGATIQLNNVFFERATPTLLATSYPELDRLAKLMIDNPTMYIELAGHTDNQGDANKNQILSEQRVEKVKAYLVSKGIAATRITGKGYGGSKPISPNDTEPHRAKNRRVEFKVVKI